MYHWKNILSTRREFIVQLGFVGTAIVAGQTWADGNMVAESDAQAASLGYKADASKVDKVKFPKYFIGQACNTCALYQGKPGDASGGCPLFAGKQVWAKGWCTAWAKKV